MYPQTPFWKFGKKSMMEILYFVPLQQVIASFYPAAGIWIVSNAILTARGEYFKALFREGVTSADGINTGTSFCESREGIIDATMSLACVETIFWKSGCWDRDPYHQMLPRKKCLNELYRLTSCKNFLKESLGTQPRRPPK